jgi:hypothetical protein
MFLPKSAEPGEGALGMLGSATPSVEKGNDTIEAPDLKKEQICTPGPHLQHTLDPLIVPLPSSSRTSTLATPSESSGRNATKSWPLPDCRPPSSMSRPESSNRTSYFPTIADPISRPPGPTLYRPTYSNRQERPATANSAYPTARSSFMPLASSSTQNFSATAAARSSDPHTSTSQSPPPARNSDSRNSIYTAASSNYMQLRSSVTDPALHNPGRNRQFSDPNHVYILPGGSGGGNTSSRYWAEGVQAYSPDRSSFVPSETETGARQRAVSEPDAGTGAGDDDSGANLRGWKQFAATLRDRNVRSSNDGAGGYHFSELPA